ncbi:serrate RNA effector molecule homolog, partial [Clupea harengus]|uniref:Serrate RNA effector molecule homolog n=1 Tax=Clupea harengus TaxID=7950 RepID=A0A8M1K4P3_CLUHA
MADSDDEYGRYRMDKFHPERGDYDPVRVREDLRGDHDPVRVREDLRGDHDPVRVREDLRGDHDPVRLREDLRGDHDPSRVREDLREDHNPSRVREDRRGDHDPSRVREDLRGDHNPSRVREDRRGDHRKDRVRERSREQDRKERRRHEKGQRHREKGHRRHDRGHGQHDRGHGQHERGHSHYEKSEQFTPSAQDLGCFQPLPERVRRDWHDAGREHCYGGGDFRSMVGGRGVNYPPPHPWVYPEAPPMQQNHATFIPPRFGGGADATPGCPPAALKGFKEFLLGLDPAVGEVEAVRCYSDYKVTFRRQQIEAFFLAHREEEWYD